MKKLSSLAIFSVLAVVTFLITSCEEVNPLSSPQDSPTVPKPTATLADSGAPPFPEIRDKVRQIWSEDKHIQGGNRYTRARDYLATMEGKKVTNWRGWVYYCYKDDRTRTYRIWPLMENPFNLEPAIQIESDYRDRTEAHFTLDGLTIEQCQSFEMGQEIEFSGTIIDTWRDARIEVAKIEAVPSLESTPSVPDDLSDLVINLERTACFGSCPVYNLTIYGDGSVVFDGERFVEKEGTHKGTVSHEKIKEIVRWFEKVGYFALYDDYTHKAWTDSPSAYTSIKLAGNSKRIAHYHGDPSAPFRLSMLEAKIDEVANTYQWIGSGKRSTDK
ncbi:MAG TPA: DUF6438 domain-containing protein [Chloroflexia bacterium]|nr:DUF6438 domain-containing protein [Chloroflexia bacterium]